MAPRGPWLAAIAFVIGLAAAAALLYPESPLAAFAGASPMAISISNIGPHEAVVRVSASYPGGAPVGQWSIVVDSGDVRGQLLGTHGQDVQVLLDARWEGVGDAGQSSFGSILHPTCRDATLVAAFELDTTRGIAFRPLSTTCSV